MTDFGLLASPARGMTSPDKLSSLWLPRRFFMPFVSRRSILWLLLHHAWLFVLPCVNSVLDRLNPLLEPGGVLPLTECGTSHDDDGDGDGISDADVGKDRPNGSSSPATSSHRVIRPHPNFRLFLTADPSCGEVSRAMRNRCVEICLLDAAPAVAVVAADPDGPKCSSASAVATTEHVADLVSVVRAAGVSDPAEATAAVAAHSALVARRAQGLANGSAGEGPASRCLLLWAELAAASRSRCATPDGRGKVLRRCMPLAYSGLSPGEGSSAEDKIAEATLAACLAGSTPSEVATTSGGVLECLVGCGFRDFVDDSCATRVAQDLKVLEIALATGASANDDGGSRGMLSMVLDAPEAKCIPTTLSSVGADRCLEADDAAFLHSAREACSSGEVSAKLIAQAAVVFVRSASPVDRRLRTVSATRLQPVPASLPVSSSERRVLAADVAGAVSWMMATLFDSPASREGTTMLSDMLSEVNAQLGRDGRDSKVASVGQALSVAGNRWSLADPRSNPDMFRLLRRACRDSIHWAPCGLLLRLVDASIGSRLPLLLAERGELAEARARISSGRGGEAGLGWLGLSCLISEGGRDFTRVGGGARCPETRLARSALVPYLLPLLHAVDGLVGVLVCRRAAEAVIAAHGGGGDVFLGAVQRVLDSRDTLSRLLSSSASSKRATPGADASAGGVQEGSKDELLFAWDPFLVSWRWLQQAFGSLRSVVWASSGIEDLPDLSSGLASLGAVSARVDAAVLQHAGGAEPTRDTLWKHGPRAAAPSSAAGAISLARIGRLADEFRVLPISGTATSHGGGGATVVSLGRLMREAHPALCVALNTRREVLHALCTLHWAASNEQVDGPSGGEKQPTGTTIGVDKSAQPDVSSSLAARLPNVLEDTLKSARARFEAARKGTRLGASERHGDSLERHQDDLELGEKFDDFDTEAAEAVASAMLLVVSGDDGGARGGDSAAGGSPPGSKLSGGGVLQDWAVVQLSPLMEHWIAVEECQILSVLADLDISAASGSAGASAASQVDDSCLAALMARVARLRSAILATPSLSPAAARPLQTLLWAWADSNSWLDVHGPLLKRLLPIALDSFGRRTWENVVGTPRSFSLQLAPPEMVAQNTTEGAGCDQYGWDSADGVAFSGPVQLLTLARSSFLLRLLGTATFRGGVVPGGGGDGRTMVDLTLMNASARLGQFRVAMRGVRDLAYTGARGGVLRPMVRLSWARLCCTLRAFDGLLVNTATASSEAGAALVPTFAKALQASRTARSSVDAVSWKSVQVPLQDALRACPDERLTSRAESLVVPAAQNLADAMNALGEPDDAGPSPRVQASAGLGMALSGCLRLVLLLPSSPVDPGLLPALKKELLGQRMEDVKGDLTVRRWSLVLEGGGDVSPQVRIVHVPRLYVGQLVRGLLCRTCSHINVSTLQPPGQPLGLAWAGSLSTVDAASRGKRSASMRALLYHRSPRIF